MSADYNTRVCIHPSTMATIVDAHERRGVDNKKSYVIGTLIGSSDSSVTTIDNAFVVNFSQVTDENIGMVFQLDKAHQAEMLGLIQAASPDKNVIGWFSTANEEPFNELDKLLFDYYANEAQKPQSAIYTPLKKQTYTRPLFLRVNVQSLRDKKASIDSLPIKAYLPECFNIIHDEDNAIQYDLMWSELPVTIGCGAAERTALDMIMKTTKLNDQNKLSLKLDAVGSNLDPLSNLSSDMLAKIRSVKAYIDQCLANDTLDETQGRMLSEIFNGVPGLDAETLEKMLNGELTDLLMVTYLSQLASTQLSINDKLKQAFAQTPESTEKKIAHKNKQRDYSKN